MASFNRKQANVITKLRDDRTRGRASKEPGPRVSASGGDIHFHTRVITLTTDFGTADFFAGAMKGVILTESPRTQIVDLTHEIPPQDIQAAAFTVLAAYRSFPAGTIHIAVVDPGVGSLRLPIVLSAGGFSFVGPDNGIFSYVCDQEAGWRGFHITNDKFFRKPVSSTFHGRDVFAPVAAALSKGVGPEVFGPEVKSLVRLESLAPEQLENGRVKGQIIHIDRFGNCVTNLTEEHLGQSEVLLEVNGKRISAVRKFFAEESGNKTKLFAIVGSTGFLEIVARNASAAELLNARRGNVVLLNLK